jgi:hypothetical protein
MRLAELLAQRDEAAAEDPGSPVLRSTIFQRDEIVVRLLDVRGGLDADPARVLGLTDARQVADLTTLLDGEGAVADGVDLRHVVELARMEPITDRCSPEE